MDEARRKAIAEESDARAKERLTGRQRARLADYFYSAGDRVVERVLSGEAVNHLIAVGDIALIKKWYEIASLAASCWSWMKEFEREKKEAPGGEAQGSR